VRYEIGDKVRTASGYVANHWIKVVYRFVSSEIYEGRHGYKCSSHPIQESEAPETKS
jgi:hypothetical protein